MRGLCTINPDSPHDVNANLWLRGDFTSLIANGHSELIKDKLKMTRKHIFLSFKMFSKRMAVLLKLHCLNANLRILSQKKTRTPVNANHPYFPDWPWHATALVF